MGAPECGITRLVFRSVKLRTCIEAAGYYPEYDLRFECIAALLSGIRDGLN